jgi:hypothetical protein
MAPGNGDFVLKLKDRATPPVLCLAGGPSARPFQSFELKTPPATALLCFQGSMEPDTITEAR